MIIPKYIFLLATFVVVSFASVVLAETYLYDSAGRLTDVIYDDGRFVHYSYDKNGNMTQKSANVVAMFSNGFE